ncbi:zinc metallopeptidase [Truepera radiovictrix]|uniref:Peptidase membrane zinc metallopeptidase putative n=1 Tax=Truepera radiovictrix (strain DSM 17093 / CIP 108686 / LMG 22925 / RQ-24) TaxID=649638 RepID=D7CXY2_TRURR|nr:zinc metallopeptidase [Truepera radiovictrix]ADI13342.1 peptidase membrane zinc metallopeptidase putative [Truepera radiovictrix DSM 17093]WMT58093.1 zinc metallopeptidase [Truepera radiovictrix]
MQGETVGVGVTGYYLIGFVAFFVSLAVSAWLRATYARWSRVQNASGLTGAEVAHAILRANNITNVRVERVPGQLSDHYDPIKRVVRLSDGIYGRASVAGMAVAAHEVGHAIQHARAYAPLQWRSALAPVANIGSQFGLLAAMMGLFLGATGMLNLGILLFSAAVLFQVITLPVEFDASRRALVQLNQLGLVTQRDTGGARSVLTAAAMTYVAAAATSIAYLLYFIMASRR